MARLEELIADSTITGLVPNQTVTVVARKPIGADTVELTYKDQR